MRKLLILSVAMLMVLALASCGSPTEEQPEEQVNYEMALVTDAGLIMDGGYSEVAWTAISEFGAENGISHKYYKAAEASAEAYKTTIYDAIAKGAKIIIVDGYSFEDVIYDVQKEHKDVKFILIDAEPMDPETGEAKLAENTVAVLFASEEAGYLAGYAAVENGATNLGFIGEADKPAFDDYGYGFVQGANAAAVNKGSSVDVKYHACNEKLDNDAVFNKATDWYEDGVDVIFACGAHIEKPIIEAAELNDGKIIACETEKSKMSDTVLISAVKDIEGVLEELLEQYARNKLQGGEVVTYDVSTDSIWLDMDTSRTVFFNENDYKSLSKQLKNKSVEISDHSIGDVTKLSLTNVEIVEE